MIVPGRVTVRRSLGAVKQGLGAVGRVLGAGERVFLGFFQYSELRRFYHALLPGIRLPLGRPLVQVGVVDLTPKRPVS